MLTNSISSCSTRDATFRTVVFLPCLKDCNDIKSIIIVYVALILLEANFFLNLCFRIVLYIKFKVLRPIHLPKASAEQLFS